VKDFASVANQASTVSVDPDVWVERLAGAEALVLDDVGAGYIDKGWTQSRLERLIDLRYRYKLPTAIISNLSPANLRVELGERAYSRLTDKAIGKVLTLENLSDVRQIERTQEGK
jgi:DNA replication protein DnaC